MAGAISDSEAAEAAALQLNQFRLEERKRDQTIMASKERQEATLKNKLAERQKRRQEQHTMAKEECRKKELAGKAVYKVSPPASTDQVTFVSAKVKDLISLWETLAANVVNSCMQVYIDTAQRVSSQYNGYVVTSSAESGPTLVAFDSAASAVHWCLSLQSELLKASWPDELLGHPSGKELVLDSNQDLILFRGLRVQMGIDRGNVQMTKQGKSAVTYSGLAVHRSNTLCNTAQGGQILVDSEAWKAATADSVTISHQANNLGSIKLSGTEKPINVFEIYPKDIAMRSKIFGSTCGGCNQPIKPGQEFLKALGYKWHTEHFCCARCGKALQGSFISQDGKPYCEEDFYEMTATKCKGCGETIKAGFIEALGGLWHPHCFVCQKCRRMPSENANIYELNSMPYCEACYTTHCQ